MRVDVCDQAEVAKAVDELRRRYGALHGAVDCAGAAERVLGKTGPHSLSMFQCAININLIGTFNVIRLAQRGVIVNTASVAASEGQIGQAAYSASKAGVAGMTLPVHGSSDGSAFAW